MHILPLLLLLLPVAAAALEVNTATGAQLEPLRGLGVETTERILQARSQRPSAGWDDLAARVGGIRGRRSAQLHQQGLTVGGAPLPADQGGGR